MAMQRKHFKHLKWAIAITLVLTSTANLGALLGKGYNKVEVSNQYVHQSASLTAWLYSPKGSDSYPAIVLLHGCAGVTDLHHRWAKTLASWGYAALILDSFSPRGVDSLCHAGDALWGQFNQLRPSDAQAAIEYLASQPQVDAERIGLMGWSYGATMTLLTLSANHQKSTALPDYKVGIAFYPSCWQYLKYLQGAGNYASVAPVYILQGSKDDWTRPEHCQSFIQRTNQTVNPVRLNLFEGAYHGFDDSSQLTTRVWDVRLESDRQPRGNITIGYNKNAHHQAQQQTKEILDRYLNNN